jgi:hypothetical protein
MRINHRWQNPSSFNPIIDEHSVQFSSSACANRLSAGISASSMRLGLATAARFLRATIQWPPCRVSLKCRSPESSTCFIWPAFAMKLLVSRTDTDNMKSRRRVWTRRDTLEVRPTPYGPADPGLETGYLINNHSLFLYIIDISRVNLWTLQAFELLSYRSSVYYFSLSCSDSKTRVSKPWATFVSTSVMSLPTFYLIYTCTDYYLILFAFVRFHVYYEIF